MKKLQAIYHPKLHYLYIVRKGSGIFHILLVIRGGGGAVLYYGIAREPILGIVGGNVRVNSDHSCLWILDNFMLAV